MDNLRLLLVDDEEEYVNALAERLGFRSIRASTAFTGERALEMVQDEEPDVMVLDLRLPGIDGMEVLRRVRKVRPCLPVIMLTGHGTDSDGAMARSLGAFEYMEKPADINVLIGVVDRAFKSRAADSSEPRPALAYGEGKPPAVG